MIVVDDGSADHTWDLIGKYAALNPRIRPFRQENKGIWRLSETYNFALAQSNGSLIAILEGDDYWPSEKLSLQVSYHDQNKGLLMSHGKVAVVKAGQIISEYCKPPVQGPASSLEYLRFALLAQSCIMPVSAILERDALEKIGGFHQDQGYPAVDLPTWLRLFELPGKVAWLKETLGYWRQSHTQATQQFSLEIAEISTQITLVYFQKLSPNIKRDLRLRERSILKERSRSILAPAYLSCLRLALRNHNQHEALDYAKKLIRFGSVKRKLQGFYAIIAIYLDLDFEIIFSFYEQVSMGVFKKIRK